MAFLTRAKCINGYDWRKGRNNELIKRLHNICFRCTCSIEFLAPTCSIAFCKETFFNCGSPGAVPYICIYLANIFTSYTTP